MLTGHCLCGAVRYEYQGTPSSLTICHCGMCRRWHGALGAYANGARANYRLTGAERIRWYSSSPGAERGFCGLCGSKLFWRSGEGMDVAAGTLDQPTGQSTTAHIWVAHKGDYYAIDDHVPQFAESSSNGARPVSGDPRPPVARDLPHRHGQCLCGAIHLHIKGPMRDVVWCHCGQCLHWHGHCGGYTASHWQDIEMTGGAALVWYRSSDTARRGFCGQCGSNLFWEGAHRKHISISAGCLDLPTGLVSAKHIFVEDKPDYYAIGDGVPVAPGSMAANPVTF